MAKKMWSFKTRNFTVIWEISKDDLYTEGMDADTARECREKVRSGEWKCFNSEVRVIENSSKKVLGQAFLGGSIYANPAEFRDHFGMNAGGYGSYFSDMIREAIAEARKVFAEYQKGIGREIATKHKLLAVKIRQPACV